jgi:hypothetical protein
VTASNESAQCSLHGSARGNTLHVDPTVCPNFVDRSHGITYAYSVASGTLSLSGTSLSVNLTGTGSFTDPTHSQSPCTVTVAGMLTKS